MTAVVLYHAGIARVRGGFLGVDVFFVLSGYLITGLLAREYLASGTLSLRRFYQRRARRLLPALFTVLAGVCVLVVMRLPREAVGFRSDAAASTFYATNWWFVAKGQSYFGGTGRPSLLLHLWSLAVEEQFYLAWPVFFVLMVSRGVGATERVRALWRAFGWAMLFALCSMGLTVLLYSPWRDPSRVYYGTDTRAFEILAGVLVALVQVARAQSASKTPGRPLRILMRAIRETGAFLALAGLLWAFAAVPATSPRLYPHGLLALSVATAVLIRALVSGCAIGEFLALRPVVWLGERSYAVYLWHWPVFDVTRPGVDVSWHPAAVFALRISLTLALAELTYRYIERPIRGGALGRVVAESRMALRERRFGPPLAATASVLGIAATGLWLGSTLERTAASHPSDTRAAAVDTGPAAALTAPQPQQQQMVRQNAGEAFPTAMPAPPAHPPRVSVVGDSQGMTLVLNRPPDTASYLQLFDDTTEGCGLLGGRITSHTGDRRDLDAECGRTLDKWAARVARDRADIAVLMIGAWDVFDERVGTDVLPFGSNAWDGYFRTRLSDAVQAIRATDVPRIELALLPCYRPFRAQGSVGGLWPERGDDARVEHVNALLTAYTGEQANHVRPLFPPPGFCQDPILAASRSFRWDGVHYYKPGARLYLRTAIPQLLAPI